MLRTVKCFFYKMFAVTVALLTDEYHVSREARLGDRSHERWDSTPEDLL